MKKFALFAAALAAIVMAGCSSAPATKAEQEPGIVTPVSSNQAISTAFAGIGVKLTYDKDGRWERISATGVAPVGRSNITGAETAVTVAEMKARRQLSEFVKSEITSKKVVTTIAETIQDSSKGSSGDSEAYARKMSDQITQTSNAILRGVAVESVSVDVEAGTATVVVFADRKTLQTANGLQKGS